MRFILGAAAGAVGLAWFAWWLTNEKDPNEYDTSYRPFTTEGGICRYITE